MVAFYRKSKTRVWSLPVTGNRFVGGVPLTLIRVARQCKPPLFIAKIRAIELHEEAPAGSDKAASTARAASKSSS